MRKKFFVLAMVVALVFSLTACVGAAAAKTAAPDYSRKDSWCRMPEITKNVDTFFIYPTEYMGFNEGDPDYATLDNAEMRAKYPELDRLWYRMNGKPMVVGNIEDEALRPELRQLLRLRHRPWPCAAQARHLSALRRV